MDSLFTMEKSIINSGKKNYMVWNGNKDDNLFARIMRCGIKLDGLINEKFKGLSLYNLRFYAEDEIDKNKSNIIRDDSCFITNSRLDGQDICIWGAGKVGMSIYKYLKNKGFYIKKVCDADADKQETEFADKINIASPHDLEKFNGVVILSGVYYREMYRQAFHINPNLTYLYQDYSLDEKVYVGFSNEVSMDAGYQLNYLCAYLHDKNVFVVGENRLYEDICNFFSYFDIQVQEFLYDLYEVLYKENYFIIIAGTEYKKYMTELEEIGLKAVDDFMPFTCMGNHLFLLRKNILDANLGYTAANDDKNVGCVVYHAKVEEKYRIAVLGGSTTDGMLYTFKSWPEILHELLDDDTVTIVNYGIAGYNSGMELVKLIRDVIYSRPDMVLVFDGVNDYASVEYDAWNPVGFKYLNSVIRYIADQNGREMFDGAAFESVTPYRRWIGNVDMMSAVLRINNIFFIDFLQPMLSGKKNKTREEELLECMDVEFSGTQSFRECYEAERKREYIIDLSDIFDDQDNVYIDCCHVNETGNEIIAAKVYDCLRSRFMENENSCRIWREP